MSVTADLRRVAGGVRRRLFPRPEMAALRTIEQFAEREGPHTPGRLRLAGLDLAFPDAQALAPQWNDIFVRDALQFACASPAPRVLDCGANIGLASLWLLRRFPEARITAFEADPAVAATLDRNLSANGAASVETIHAAVWSAPGVVGFRRQGSDSGAVEATGSNATGELVEVPSVRLRDWIARERIDLLKLDVEGAELDLLEDCADALANVAVLQMEVHDFDGGRRRLPRCLLELERVGFDYTLGDLHQASWRSEAMPAGPFDGVAAWVIAVRAWRRDPA